jgi:hypothetical protein
LILKKLDKTLQSIHHLHHNKLTFKEVIILITIIVVIIDWSYLKKYWTELAIVS